MMELLGRCLLWFLAGYGAQAMFRDVRAIFRQRREIQRLEREIAELEIRIAEVKAVTLH